MATVQRRGYLVCLWPNPYERVLVVTENAPLWLERHIYGRLDDDQFEAFMTKWLAGDYAQSCIALGESDPRDGLKALAEANEREKAAQAAMGRSEPDTLPELVSRLRGYGLNEAADFFESVKPVEVRQDVIGMEVLRSGDFERIPSRGNVYSDPDDTPWPTLDQEPWQPCADCLAPSVCETSDTELCP